MSRIRANAVAGTLTSSLASSDTTMSSANLADLPVVASPDVAAIVIDPESVGGKPELVWVTAHSSGATSATIQRAAETGGGLNGSGRAHNAGVKWVHCVTTTDFAPLDETVSHKVVYRSGNVTPTGFVTPTGTDITGLTAITFTADGTSRYRISARVGSFNGPATMGMAVMELYEGATRVAILGDTPTNNANAKGSITGAFDLVPSAGSHTYKIRCRYSDAAASSVALYQQNTEDLSWALVERLGA